MLPNDIIEKLASCLGLPKPYATPGRHDGWSRSRENEKIGPEELGRLVSNGLCVDINDEEGKQHFAIFDVDNGDDFEGAKLTTLRLIDALRVAHVNFFLTFSGSKGFHAWVFLDTPLPSETVNAWQHHILRSAGFDEQSIGAFVDENTGTIIETLFATGRGKVIKIIFSRHQKQSRRDFFELPIAWGQIAGYDRDRLPTEEDFNEAIKLFRNCPLNASDHISSIIEGETARPPRRRREQGTTVVLPAFRTPTEMPERIPELTELIENTPCLKYCHERAKGLSGIYWERAMLVSALSRANYTPEEIAYYFQHEINDDDDNANVGKLEYQVNYWYPKTGQAQCRVLQNPRSNKHFCQMPEGCPLQYPGDRAAIDPQTIEEYTNKIIEAGNDCVIHKATRAGVTTNIIISSVLQNKRILVLVPTNKIATNTVSEAMHRAQNLFQTEIKAGVVGDNRVSCLLELQRIREIRQQHYGDSPPPGAKTAYEELPFVVKHACKNCAHNNTTMELSPYEPVYRCDEEHGLCSHTTIMANLDNFDVLILTYAKLHTILLSTSDTAMRIRMALEDFNVILFDEVRHFADTPELDVLVQQVDISGEEVYNFLKKLEREIDRLIRTYENRTTHDIQSVGGTIKGKLRPHIRAPEQTSLDEYRQIIREDCVKIRNLLHGDDEIDIRLRFFSRYAQIIRYVAEFNEGLPATIDALQLYMKEEWIVSDVPNLDYKVNLSAKTPPGIERTSDWLRGLDAQLILTDATMPIADLSAIFDRDLAPVRIKDTRNMAGMQLIITDTKHIAASDLINDMTDVYRVLECDFQAFTSRGLLDKYIVVAPSKKIAADIKNWILRRNYPSVPVTYHRSDMTIGVSSDKRIMRNLCGPYPPENAYDYLAMVYPDSVGNFSKQDRQQHGAATAYIQTTGRVKDPSAEENSIVLNYGITHRETTDLLRNSLDRPKVVVPPGAPGTGKYYLQVDGWMDSGTLLTARAINEWVQLASSSDNLAEPQ